MRLELTVAVPSKTSLVMGTTWTQLVAHFVVTRHSQIKQTARNPLQLQQLAQAVLEHYKGGAGGAVTPDDRTEYAAHVAVIEGIVESLRMLKKRNGGRYTREDRIAQHVLLSASVLKSGNKKMQASIRRLLETSSKSIDKAVARNTDAATMERPYFFVEDEKLCNSYPVEWGTYITGGISPYTAVIYIYVY